MVRCAEQEPGIAPSTMIMSLCAPRCKPKWVRWLRDTRAHKEVCRKVLIMTSSMILTPATRKTNLMTIPNKIRDRVGKCERWPHRTTAYLREIVGKAALGTFWTPMKILLEYLFRSVVLQLIETRGKVPRMLQQTWPQGRKEETLATFRWANNEARGHKVTILLGMQVVCRGLCKIDRICLEAIRSLPCWTKEGN